MYSADRVVRSEDIIARMKADLNNPANRIEGSFASDNIQAVGKEMAKYYSYVNWLHDMHYVQTAEGQYLDDKAEEEGVFRKAAQKAVGEVTFTGKPGTVIPQGFIVRSDTLRFEVTEQGVITDTFVVLPVRAIEAGSDSNLPEGAIYLFDSLEGLTSVNNKSIIFNGTDVEDDDSLRERTLLRMRYPGTSGNIYHYLHWAMEVDGVGRVKVFPEWDGAGTVKVSVLDSNQKTAGEDLLLKVKNHIDPGHRDGSALAPIGALLTVSTAEEIPVSVTAKIQLITEIEGYTIEGVQKAFEYFLEEHFKDISYMYDKLTFAKVVDILWSIEGVDDILEISVIYSHDDGSDNLQFGEEEIPVLGTVEMTV